MFDATTNLFGLAGVRVERVERLADGTRMVHVVTADAGAATCPSCGVVSRSVKERTATSPKDIPYGENGILLRGVRPGNRVPVRQGRLPRSDSRWIRPMPRRR